MSSWRRTLAFCTVGGLIVPLMHVLLMSHVTWQHLLETSVFSFSYSTSIGVFIQLGLTLVGPRLNRRRSGALAWSTLILMLVLCATLGCFAGSAVAMTIMGIPWNNYLRISMDALRICIPISLAVGIVMGMLDSVRSQLQATEIELRTRERDRERAEKLAAEARLSSLESRIHPHFMFNALNSISSLIREDPERAERLIERMAALLRFSLDSNQLGLVPLSDELKIVRDYLEIEQARFGDRLRYSIDLATDASGLHVPPLSVQTLVENSIKYAVSSRREGGEVRVTARGTTVEVQDDGPGFSLEHVPAGHGIDLLQSRLDALFGDAAQLQVDRNTVTLRFDARVPA